MKCWPRSATPSLTPKRAKGQIARAGATVRAGAKVRNIPRARVRKCTGELDKKLHEITDIIIDKIDQ
jgi:hypothetical protein